jgi:NADPH-dependent glutamate synthase beta subunit-like oxidoreductase
MGLVGKKKKKKLSSRALAGGGSQGAGGKATSDRRPSFVDKMPPCRDACPSSNAIREIMRTFLLAEKKEQASDDVIREAWNMLTETSPFPSTCGRVCPHPCETACNREAKDGAVSINNIERFLGDYAIEHDLQYTAPDNGSNTEKIAVIGAGPAGLSCAYQLARKGYKVTVFESFDKAGGMLRYGIPAYRLPRNILDAEIAKIEKLGVEIRCNTIIGKDIAYEDIKKDYDAIFVGIGAHKGKLLRCEGEDASNVYTGTFFLHKVNSGENVELGSDVIVIGGGDTAIDAARMAKRAGAKVTIFYRRTRNEMPAIDEEIEGALEEDIAIEYLVAPINITKNGEAAVSMTCQRMELGEPDDSGRRRPVPIEGSEFDTPATAIIAAISQEPDFDGLEDLREGRDWVKSDASGQVVISDQPVENTFAGGDALDLGLVTMAIGNGRLAATTIHERFRGIEPTPVAEKVIIKHDKMLMNFYEQKARNTVTPLAVSERWSDPDVEILPGLSQEQAIEEAMRCMSCASCFDCGTCWSYCQDNVIVKAAVPGDTYKLKLEFCQGCDKCAENCPCGYIEMH